MIHGLIIEIGLEYLVKINRMKLILKKAVEGLGEPGDVVDVKAGYARNYLIPQGLSYTASSANLKKLQEDRNRLNEEARR